MAEVTTLTKQDDQAIIERVVLHGDLAELSPRDRVAYYARVCDSLGLNPFTRPFEFIKLNNKLTLYARRDATDQLRSLKDVSIKITGKRFAGGVYEVTARATMGKRSDESTGAVDISNLKGDARANAIMKAETKAKRRVTLSIVGLGWLDETEVGDISPKDAQTVAVNLETGEIQDDQPKGSIEQSTQEPTDNGAKDPPAATLTTIDMVWLKDAIAQLQWKTVGAWIVTQFPNAKGITVKALVESLTWEQQEKFVAEVQKKLAEKGNTK